MTEDSLPVFLVEPLAVQLRALQEQWRTDRPDGPEAKEYCADDLQAVILYLRSLPPIPDQG